ncbi:hypothetical protein [Thiohalophilus thiocyanatoxydans]|uniref:Uncharacterized protein n=1 Tax=Thiohalophilus thiocyanatoxydans TaxID=381308 RepID=A0A4R8IQ21_9GAMM|nr:hypothetical protein [Thiohalophilus thiocyanatoxydans]TDX99636.1 hypothetical protein EDC23_2421 [Thiohalophilus thiocyanatoxydans]
MPQNNITISAFGFDKRSIERLSQAISPKVRNIRLLDSVTDAQLFLLNLEAENMAEKYRDIVKDNQSIPAIGFCNTEADGWAIRSMKMPINTDELIDSIRKELPDVELDVPASAGISEDRVKKAMEAIETKIETKKVASKLNTKIEQDKSTFNRQREMIRKTDEMCFDLDRFLLGRAIEALDTSKQGHESALIKCWGHKSILIQPAKGEVLTNLSDNQIRSMAIAPLDDRLSSSVEVTYLDRAGVDSVAASISGQTRSMSVETFMWDLGLLTCKGRIPYDISTADRQYLRRWPNITRIKLTDDGLKIIAYWARNPCSLYEMSEKLELPLQEVFSIFTAAHAAGLADRARREADAVVEPVEVPKNEKRGLFGSLLSRLRNMDSEVA